MAAANIYSLAPLTLNSTTLATENLRVSPEVASIAFRHSGNEFPSVVAIPGAGPRIMFSTPFYEAYALIGLKHLKCTTVSIYLAKFADATRSASSVHRSYTLAASALGHATIRGASVSQGGVMMAEVEVLLLSSDGMTHPLSTADNAALPSLAGQPALRTVGPIAVNGTTINGVVGMGLDTGNSLEAMISDGHLYPTVSAFLGGNPAITIEHADPVTLGTTLGLTGVALSSSFVAYARDYSTSTHLASATGLSFTIASGRVIPVEFGADNLGVARGGLRCEGLSTSSTHPIVVATGASVPAA